MATKKETKPRRARLPQRYYPAADTLARVFRWNHIHAHRGGRWRLSFRVKALARLAGIPDDGDARDTYLDALAVLQARGELDGPEVQKHTDALAETAEQVERWHRRREAESAQQSATQAPAAADFDDPWEELRDEFAQFIEELEPEQEKGDDDD